MPPAKSKTESAPEKSRTASTTGWVAIINAVKTPLGFFVLVVLVIETILGGLAAKGPNQLTALYGMFFFLVLLIGVVVFLAVFRIDTLMGKSNTSEGSTKLRKFCEGLCGYWWEVTKLARASKLSVVEVSHDSSTDTLKLQGRMYSSHGELLATWDSLATCASLGDRRVFYYWTGRIFQQPNETQGGIGEIHFYESLRDADGFYSEANLADFKNATRKNVTFKRSSDQEKKILKDNKQELVAELVRRKSRRAA